MADVSDRDQYQQVTIQGVSSVDNRTRTNVQVNPVTHATVVEVENASDIGGGTQYTDAAAAPANPVGNTIEWNEGGTWRTVSSAKPLPVTATLASTTITGTVAATQSGTWILGANSGVDIGDVTINNASGGSAVNIQDGGNSITVDNGGTFVVQENGTWVQADDAAFTPATSKIAMVGAEFDDSSPDSVDEGDGGAIRMSGNRNLYVRIRDNAGNERGLNIDANGALAATVTNATAANLNMTEASAASTLTSVQLIDDIVYTDDTSTHATGTSKGALIMAAATPTDGSVNANDIGAVAMTTDRKLHVSVQDSLPAGTNAIGKLSSNTGVTIGAVEIAAAQTLATVTTVSTVTNLSQMNGAAISMGVGATGTGVQRVVVANDAGRTLLSKGGQASSSGNNTLVVAGTNRLKVYAFSLSTVSTTAVTCIFQSGASGTELWRVTLQTPASVAGGANLVVQPPAWLFATASATLLNLNLSAAVAVDWSVSYYDEA